MTRKSILLDLGIELAGAAIIAAIVWLATVASATIALPAWGVITIAACVTIAVAALVAYVGRARHFRKTETELRQATDARRTASQALRAMRDLNRTLGEQLILTDQYTVLRSTTAYTVDPEGDDRIDSTWVVAYKEEYQGRAFTTDDWSSQPPTGEVSCTRHGPIQMGSQQYQRDCTE